mgnify:CR=1 FL=1
MITRWLCGSRALPIYDNVGSLSQVSRRLGFRLTTQDHSRFHCGQVWNRYSPARPGSLRTRFGFRFLCPFIVIPGFPALTQDHDLDLASIVPLPGPIMPQGTRTQPHPQQGYSCSRWRGARVARGTVPPMTRRTPPDSPVNLPWTTVRSGPYDLVILWTEDGVSDEDLDEVHELAGAIAESTGSILAVLPRRVFGDVTSHSLLGAIDLRSRLKDILGELDEVILAMTAEQAQGDA